MTGESRRAVWRSMTEADFCTCGYPLTRRGGEAIRRCIACGSPEPVRRLRVREHDGVDGLVPVAVVLREAARTRR